MAGSAKRLRYAVVLIWLLIGAQWLIYGWFAQVSIATPPLWLLFGFLVPLIGAAIYVAWFGMAQLVFGPRRLLVVSLILFALTPAIWSATFVVDLRYRTVERESLDFDFPTRAIGYWAASIADVQAIGTKPVRTEGQHVRLYAERPFDTAEQLVAEMDQHIVAMAETLGCDPPDIKSRWVRGKLLGFGGRALLCWGICDTNETKLAYLDRHEVAHTLITILAGAGQDPPMLLAEGWAQVNSADVESDIKQRYTDLASGSHCPIKDLLGPTTYGASIGKAYSYGGPFCSWLLSEFGGEKFFEIYSTIRRDSYQEDFSRVFGKPFDELEAEFWEWIKNHPAAKNTEEAPVEKLEFAESVDQEQWNELLGLYRESQPDSVGQVPWGLAVELKVDIQPDDKNESWRFVFDPDKGAWLKGEILGSVIAQAACDDLIMDAEVDPSGFVSGNLVRNDQRNSLQQQIHQMLVSYFGGNPDPRTRLPRSQCETRTIEKLTGPSDGKPYWEVTETNTYKESPIASRITFRLDPKNHFWVSRFEHSTINDPNIATESEEQQPPNRWLSECQFLESDSAAVPIGVHTEQVTGSGENRTISTSVRRLDQQEQSAILDDIKMIARSLTLPRKPLLNRGSALASWLVPLLASILLLVSALLGSFFNVPKKIASPDHPKENHR